MIAALTPGPFLWWILSYWSFSGEKEKEEEKQEPGAGGGEGEDEIEREGDRKSVV